MNWFAVWLSCGGFNMTYGEFKTKIDWAIANPNKLLPQADCDS